MPGVSIICSRSHEPGAVQRGAARYRVCVMVEFDGFCLMKGIAEGTYNSKHAEAARLYYTTILLCYHTTTLALKSSGAETRRRSKR